MEPYQRILAPMIATIAFSTAPCVADGSANATQGFATQNTSGIWIDGAFWTGAGQTNNGLQNVCANFTNTSDKIVTMVELNFAYVDHNDADTGMSSDQLSVKGTFPPGVAIQSSVGFSGVDGITCRMPSVALGDNETVEASVIAVKYADGTSWQAD